MKTIMNVTPFLNLIFTFVISISNSQTIEVSGIIDHNTIWNVDTVKIFGDITVENNVCLNIDPGVYIESQNYYKLTVEGTINAIGLPDDSITFTVNDTTGFWTDTTSVAGGWHGIYIMGENGSTDSSIFKYCKFHFGKKYDDYGGDINGGALYVYNHGLLYINHCLFSNNMVICYTNGVDGPYGGAVYCEKVDKVLIDSSSFIKNRSFYFSGAIRIDENCYNTVITNNIFIHNVGYYWKDLPPPWGSVYGGGGAAISTSDLVYSPVISNNYCFNNKGLNGIIYTSNLHSRIFNNVICNNWGCGIADGHQLSTSRTFNNTIVNNKTEFGGILLWSQAEVYNNVCWGNEYFPGLNYDQIHIDDANPSLYYNCVQYGNGGQGAIYDYPEFVNPTEGVGLGYDGSLADWTLQNTSPCINAGTPDTNFLTIPEYDIVGNIRVYGNRIDMGAYENQVISTFSNEIILLGENARIFPNPATTTVTVNINNSTNQDSHYVNIFDAFGKEIFSTIFPANEISLEVNVTNWKRGLYLVAVSSSNEILSKTKLIVK